MPYWIDAAFPGRLAIAPRPRGGDALRESLGALRSAGVDHLVSLLTPDEARDLVLDGEAEACRSLGIDFDSFPVGNRGIPVPAEPALALAERLAQRLREGRNVAIHCRMGIGRAPLLAACTLLRLGITLPEALNLLSRARGLGVPETVEQRQWLASLPIILRRTGRPDPPAPAGPGAP